MRRTMQAGGISSCPLPHSSPRGRCCGQAPWPSLRPGPARGRPSLEGLDELVPHLGRQRPYWLPCHAAAGRHAGICRCRPAGIRGAQTRASRPRDGLGGRDAVLQLRAAPCRPGLFGRVRACRCRHHGGRRRRRRGCATQRRSLPRVRMMPDLYMARRARPAPVRGQPHPPPLLSDHHHHRHCHHPAPRQGRAGAGAAPLPGGGGGIARHGPRGLPVHDSRDRAPAAPGEMFRWAARARAP